MLAPTRLKITETKEINMLYFADLSDIHGFGCHYDSLIPKKIKKQNKECPNEFETFLEGNDSDYPTYDPNILMLVKQNGEVLEKEEKDKNNKEDEVQEKEEKEKNDKEEKKEKEEEEQEEEEEDDDDYEAEHEQQTSQVYPSEDMSEEQLQVKYMMDNNLYYEEGEDDRKPANIDMTNFSDIEATVCNQVLWLVDGNCHFIIENIQGQWSKKFMMGDISIFVHHHAPNFLVYKEYVTVKGLTYV